MAGTDVLGRANAAHDTRAANVNPRDSILLRSSEDDNGRNEGEESDTEADDTIDGAFEARDEDVDGEKSAAVETESGSEYDETDGLEGTSLSPRTARQTVRIVPPLRTGFRW